MFKTLAIVCLLCPILIACSAPAVKAAGGAPRVSMQTFVGWYKDERVFYITSDISDAVMGQMAGANYAPRLRDAVPTYPKAPGVLTVLERVYKFPGGEQDAVFASAPEPLGPQSHDTAYSPLWLLYTVNWKDPSVSRVLTSEAAVLNAQESGEIVIERTNIVINCPIIAMASGAHLPGVLILK